MIHAYINVQNPHLTVHGDPTCGFVQDMRSPRRRVLTINPSNLGRSLADLEHGAMKFAPRAGLNGLWLRIELDNSEQETDAAGRVKFALASRYRRLRDAPTATHCE